MYKCAVQLFHHNKGDFIFVVKKFETDEEKFEQWLSQKDVTIAERSALKELEETIIKFNLYCYIDVFLAASSERRIHFARVLRDIDFLYQNR